MKAIIKTWLAAIVVLIVSCTKENTTIQSSAVEQSTNKSLTFTIGQHYGGGIIFYIDTSGQHGLIADTADLPQAKWWNGTNMLTGASKTRINSGKSNTRKIISAQGKPGSYAALLCGKSKRNGYSDWFLPSQDELYELYKQKTVVGGFVNSYYWTSSEGDTDYAWFQNFAGGQSFASKSTTFNVRAIRAF